MRVALPLLLFLVSVGGASADEAKTSATHHDQILSALQEKFRYAGPSQPNAEAPPASAEVVAMKPFVVSVSRDLAEKLQPKISDKPFDPTQDVKVISNDVGGLHLDLGMMKYVPVIPERGSSLPKVTILNIRF